MPTLFRSLCGLAILASGIVADDPSTGSSDSDPTPGWVPPYTRDDTAYYTILDIDACEYPTMDEVPVDLPEDPYTPGQTYLDANLYMWQGLNMDKWIDALVQKCPAMLNATCDGQMCKFDKVLGRYMVGNSDVAHSSPQCTANRCNWESLGANSNRGDIQEPDNTPNILLRPANTTAAGVAEFAAQVLAYRRWYTMNSLLQLWEWYVTMDNVLSDAALVNTDQLDGLVNTFMPDHKDATTSLDNIFDIISAVASLTPWGNAVNLLVDAVKIGKDFVDGGPKKAASGSDIKSMGGDIKTALGDNRKVMGKRIASVAWVMQDIGKLDMTPLTTPATDTAPISVKVADLGNFMGTFFLSLKSNWEQARDSTINGDPIAPGGFLTLVKGGLYSGTDGMDATRTDTARRQMTDYIQDKILSHIFQSQQLWIYKKTYDDLNTCTYPNNENALRDWDGEQCTPDPNNPGKYILYIPIAGQAAQPSSTSLAETYDALTDSNFASLKRATTPLTMSDIALGSTKCANIINADLYTNGNSYPLEQKLPSKDGDPSPAPTWSSEIGDAVSPIDDSCHWSVPVLDLDQQVVNDICCLKQQRQGQDCFDCTTWLHYDHDSIYQGRFEFVKGPGLYLGRQWWYPGLCPSMPYEEYTGADSSISYYENYNRCMNPPPPVEPEYEDFDPDDWHGRRMRKREVNSPWFSWKF